MAEKRTTYKIKDVGGIGEVKIADEVVTIIAALAATEVEGVEMCIRDSCEGDRTLLEAKLESILENTEGVGKVQVLLMRCV